MPKDFVKEGTQVSRRYFSAPNHVDRADTLPTRLPLPRTIHDMWLTGSLSTGAQNPHKQVGL